MKESIFMMAKTAIKPLSDQSSFVSWISEHKDIFSNVEINIIIQHPTFPGLGQKLRRKLRQTGLVKRTFRKLGETKNVRMQTGTIGLNETELS